MAPTEMHQPEKDGMNFQPLKVLKFGGSSVGTAQRMRSVADLIDGESRSNRVVVVVSALGGVTDLLEELFVTASPALLFRIEGRHIAASAAGSS